MTPLEAVREIIADCERDVAAMDGKPLTGPNVAQWFAETLAMIQALARIVEPLVEHTHGVMQNSPNTFAPDKPNVYVPRNEISDRFEPR